MFNGLTRKEVLSLKNRILELRKSKGITQEQLAEMSGVSRPTISKLENEENVVVKSNTLIALSEALGEPIENIFF